MVKIMVDSASDCQGYDVYDYFMPICVTVGGKDYMDGVDLTSDAFYDLLTGSESFPKTAQPSPQAYMDIFESVKKSGDELVYFALSSGLSGTYQSANIAKELVDYDKIYIVDSRFATHCIHLMAGYAHRLAAEGLSGAEIVQKSEILRSKIRIFAGLDTLEYLYRGGRLSKASATVGEIANIKPILTITDAGTIEPAGKVIGKARAIQTVAAKLDSFEIDENFPIWTAYTQGTENCEKLEQILAKNGHASSRRMQIGPTIGAHVGPGLYGVLFVIK